MKSTYYIMFILLISIINKPLAASRMRDGADRDCAALYSQFGVDHFVFRKFFMNKKTGVFVDIGAHDGITFSNTYFFERHCGWKGICIEPIPRVFEHLVRNRSSICVQGCISDREEEASFALVEKAYDAAGDMLSGLIDKFNPGALDAMPSHGIVYKKITVRCYRLNDLLEKNGLYNIDFMSIDTEGGELDILKSIDFQKFKIDVICVENNAYNKNFAPFMQSVGYVKIDRQPSPIDELYVREDFLRSLD